MSFCNKPIAECVQAANLGDGIEKAVMIKNLSRFNKWWNLNKQCKKRPPTPLDISNNNCMEKKQPLQSIRMDSCP